VGNDSGAGRGGLPQRFRDASVFRLSCSTGCGGILPCESRVPVFSLFLGGADTPLGSFTGTRDLYSAVDSPAVLSLVAYAGQVPLVGRSGHRLTIGSSDRGVARSLGQGEESMIGINQLRWSSAHPRVAQPHR
jgi:hypothetical protein